MMMKLSKLLQKFSHKVFLPSLHTQHTNTSNNGGKYVNVEKNTSGIKGIFLKAALAHTTY